MRTIDVKSEEAIYQLQINLENKQKEQLAKGEYTVDDFALVRTSNHLEEDHVLKPICSIPFVTTINSVASSAVFQLLREKNQVNIFNEEEYESLRELAKNFTPLSSQYRSTIHFTLNGLVSSHSKGTFDDKNFIIIDRLNKHLGVDNIGSIRMEDTFVSGSFNISEDSTILIKKSRYPELIATYPWLETYNVVLYEGSEKMAVEAVLLEMGITPERIETHSAEYSKRTPLYEDSLSNIAQENGIQREKHIYSKEYKEDDNKSLELWQIYDKYFYQALFSYFNVNDNNMIEFLSTTTNDRKQQEEMLKQFISSIGLDKYCDFVLKYNQDILEHVKNGRFPSNEEILANQQIILKGEDKVI